MLHGLLACLVVLALLLSFLRYWLLPRAENYRAVLETRIGEQVGNPVRIGTLAASLHGLQPELALHDVRVLGQDGRTVLRFDELHVGLDSWRSLASGEPVFARMEIRGVHLSLRRREDGSFGLLGLDSGGGMPTWLLADGRFELLDCGLDFQDLQTGAPLLALGKADIRLDNRGGRHRLGLELKDMGKLGAALRLSLEAEGDVLRADGWQGRAYLEGRELDLARFAAALPASAHGLRQGQADTRVWLQWGRGLERVAGDLNLAAPRFFHRKPDGSEATHGLRMLAGRFDWHRLDDGWRLDLAGLRHAAGATPWPETRIALAVRNGADGRLADAAGFASYLDLADLRGFLPLLDEPQAASLQTAAPRGTLHDLRLFVAPEAPLGERLALCGWFQGIGVEAWNALPAFSGLGGKICGNDRAGHAEFFVRAGQMQPAVLGLKRPIPISEAGAELDWTQGETDWDIEVSSFSLHNRELNARGRFRLALDKTRAHSPFLDLQARLEGLDVGAARHYLPYGVIPFTSAWLEKSLIKGRARESALLFHGFTGDFPFIANQGVFQVRVEAEGVELRFHPDWLPLAQADARLWFDGPGLVIDAKKGRIGAGEIVEAHAGIPDLGHEPWLHLQGKVRSGVADSLDYLAHSPIRDIPKRLGKFVHTAGQAEIDLHLEVPLDSKLGETAVQGSAKFQDATLELRDLGLAVGKINGPLHFTRTGLQADAIRARLLGEPIDVDVEQDRDDIRIAVRGRAELPILRKQFPSPWWERAQGGADYRLSVSLPKSLDARSAPVRLELQSDLRGLAVDLPEPFGKTAAESHPLALGTSLREGGEIPLEIAYGPDVRARLRFGQGKAGLPPVGGEFAVGMDLPPAGGAGFAVCVKQAELDADRWRQWLGQDAAAGDGAGAIPPVRQWVLDVGKLLWNGKNFGAVSLNLEQAGAAWNGSIGGDLAQGKLALAPERIRLDLDTLALPDFVAAQAAPTSQVSAQVPSAFDPASLPDLEVKARRITWKKVDLGSLRLQSERHAQGAVLKTLSLEGAGHALALEGSWSRAAGQDGSSTRVQGKIHLDDLGKFLGNFGQPGQIRDTRADVDVKLSWPGAPHEFARATVAGEVGMKLGKGAILEIEPGLGRVLGMLSLDTIWRRLSFDFSDLFSKGLAYDGVAGTFQLGGGQARTKGFLIDAVSAKILITGRAGLVARDLDQMVVVIPHTSVALPVAGALAGGPAVGAAVLLAQQLVGDKVDSITATQYSVRGPWDHPVIVKVNNNLPLDMLDRAWSGVKDLSGFSNQEKEQGKQHE